MRLPRPTFRKAAGAAIRDERGVAALEMATTAPVFILMFFGMAELGQGLIASRRVTHACSALGDLVAQASILHNADEQDAFSAASDIMTPMSTASLKLRVTSITGVSQGNGSGNNGTNCNPTGKVKPIVDWSDGNNGWSGYTAGVAVPVTLPAGLICNAGDTIILSEASYNYTSPVGYVLPNGLAFTRSSYLRPRQGTVQRANP